MEVQNLSWSDVGDLADLLTTTMARRSHSSSLTYPSKIYPVPRGGVYAAMLLLPRLESAGLYMSIVEDPKEADLYVDDIIDSGDTQCRVRHLHGNKPFYALLDKQPDDDVWYSFPWERMLQEAGPEENVVRLLEYIGENPKRDGLKDTPARVVKAYQEMFSGYKVDINSLFTTFDAESYDEMILLRDIPFISNCEHHMLPFSGTVTLGYVPSDGKIVGVSKLARVVDAYARRLQVQERMTSQIVKAVQDNLHPLGVGCVVKASHLCMSCRGVKKEGCTMVTSQLLGVFRDHAVRAEFLNLS